MILNTLETLFRPILEKYTDHPEKFFGMITRCNDPKFGDYQANFAMGLAKSLGKKPRDVAAELRDAVMENAVAREMFEKIDIAGPGFLNLTFSETWLKKMLLTAAADGRLGIPMAEKPQTIVLDYSSPNVAKPMHVGHIRSTVIGNSLYRILKFLGHRVIGDNHLGDWGTQFGMILWGWKHFRDEAAFAEKPVEELTRLYRLARQKMDENEAIADECRRETEKLHSGDAENRALWSRFMPFCLDEIDRVYRRLDVTFDETLGESFYNDRLPQVVEILQEKGLITESDGAKCVFLPGREAPMIVQKSDGAYLYATTDLATVMYRMEQFHPDAILYIVDHRQSEHFEMFFETARKLGYEQVDLRHVKFGTVLGEDRRPFKTRSGDTVGLEGLLDEAVERAKKILVENGTETDVDETASRIGIAALKYADLSQNRDSDYIFSYDKMLAMNGNTATYMQYAYARVCSIFTKANDGKRPECGPIDWTHPSERALAMELLRFDDALAAVVKDYRPNFLSNYLYDLANRYSVFFENCSVLRAESEEIRRSRLRLCDLTARTLQKGLELLGIQVVSRM
ncbi:MAG: arginine--tRNA ligase [Planctomycetia bacterium]|nr:arginine--tRNA ligase [Planctomycetia bacterium]